MSETVELRDIVVQLHPQDGDVIFIDARLCEDLAETVAALGPGPACTFIAVDRRPGESLSNAILRMPKDDAAKVLAELLAHA